MLKILLLTIALFPLSALPQSTNIIVSTHIQWSTNAGLQWNDDLNTNDYSSAPIDFISTSNGFCSAKITSDDGFLDVYKKLTVETYYSPSLLNITNLLTTSEFYVIPSIYDGYGSNVIYRPFLTISYQAPSITDTNNYPANTNLPPVP